ncbi:hypothetical protein [Micromonospora coxensis]|uniref:Uncharacterized protein n=1 Tax=Micromonospora coxensis TaxID=356852 RepID=A0A1C5JBH4_9ACTN|nr:hypothetical protein [Micromonospora coxensis]SCG67915.1 hypothetical protein GA0070614_4317 [Micromonospora coxensis]
MNHGLHAGLAEYIQDDEVTAALCRWAAGYDGTVCRLAQSRRTQGYSGAVLFTIAFRRPGRNEKLFVKVLPAGRDAPEPGQQERAWSSAPDFAARHLVRQPYSWYPVGDGRHLMFQSVANGGDPVSALTELTDDETLVSAVRAVVTGLLTDWNGDAKQHPGVGPSIRRADLPAYVGRELAVMRALPEARAAARELGLVTPDADWVRLDGRVLPNPLRLADDDSLFAGFSLDHLCGFSHGDLHGGNALIPAPGDGPVDPHRFWLVDLDNYQQDAPLTRDLICLLLTTVLRWIAPPPDEDGASQPGLPPDQAESLLDHLVRPDDKPSPRLPSVLATLVGIVHEAGMAYAERDNWKPEWRQQYRLSLISQALTCMTFDSVTDAGRTWCFRLAAHAAEAHRRAHHPAMVPPPPQAVPVPPSGGSTPTTRREAGPDSPHPPDPVEPAWPQDTMARSWQTSIGPVGAQVTAGARPGRHRVDTATSPAGPTAPQTRTRNAAPNSGGRTSARPAADPPAGTPELRPRNPTPGGPAPRLRRRMNVRSLRVGGRRTVPLTRLVAILGTSLLPLLLPGVTVEPGRSGSVARTPVRDESEGHGHGASTTTPVVDVAAPPGKLRQLAEAVAALPEPVTQGRYAYTCLRVWSPKDLAYGSENPNRYREELLWWTTRRSGRRMVTAVEDGRRAEPVVTRYDDGELTDVPPNPATDPAELRRQVAAQLDRSPPELRNAAGVISTVAWIYRYRPLTSRQRAALLVLLAETPGVTYQGSYPDRADRVGHAISAADGEGRWEVLTFHPTTGQLLSHETTGPGNNLLSYFLLLSTTRTDSTAQTRCGVTSADSRPANTTG